MQLPLCAATGDMVKSSLLAQSSMILYDDSQLVKNKNVGDKKYKQQLI
jgi:hypothetical protein